MPLAATPPVLPPLAIVTPAPFFWRIIALALDCSLTGLAAWIILVRLVLPQTHPNAASIVDDQLKVINAAYERYQATGERPQLEYSDDIVGIFQDAGNTFFLTLLVYFSASELATGGTTLGKRAFGLRTARWLTGEPPSPTESLTRSLVKVASLLFMFPLLLLVDVIPVFARASRRAGHDYLARTCVTRAPMPVSAQQDRHAHADDD